MTIKSVQAYNIAVASLGQTAILLSNLPSDAEEMSKAILIRDVPDSIRTWVHCEKDRLAVSQQEFLISLLDNVRRDGRQLSLFEKSGSYQAVVEPNSVPFTFVDLFAGIGGFRLALESLGGNCLFSCENDRFSQKTYRAWYGEVPDGDIRKIRPADIPDHDVLAAGFPCQPFSIAGVSKKKSLGRAHGFKCNTQGTLFFHLATIAEIKRPPVLFLENVKNLRSHDQGKTWMIIRSTLEELDYVVFDKTIDAADYVPQHRERIMIVCFDRRVFGASPPFEFPAPPSTPRKLRDILDDAPDPKYTLTDHLWSYLQEYAKRHRARGNGFGFGLADLDGITRTLSARYYKDGSEILIPQRRGNPRRLTPRECARLMGFSEELPVVVSDTQAYRQFGNAVVPAVIKAVGRQIVKVLNWQLTRDNRCLLKS